MPGLQLLPFLSNWGKTNNGGKTTPHSRPPPNLGLINNVLKEFYDMKKEITNSNEK